MCNLSINAMLGLASLPVSRVVVEAPFKDPRKADNPPIQMLFTARLYHKRFISYLMFCKTCASVASM